MSNVTLNKDYEQIDAENMRLYAEHGVKSGSKMIHRCVICGGETCIDDGVSCSGHNFVCGRCAWDRSKFVSPVEAKYWADGEEMPLRIRKIYEGMAGE